MPVKVSVAFSVTESGAVKDAVATGGEEYPGLPDCVVDHVRRIVFPGAEGTTKLNVPFLFMKGEEDASEPSDDTLTPSDITKLVSAQRPTVKEACWQPAESSDGPELAKVKLQLGIAPSGNVDKAVATGGDGYPSLAPCVAGLARGWSFPSSSKSTTVSIPFLFRRTDS